jgi:hypothetical protein
MQSALAMRHALLAAATTRDFPEAGLLMSYGASNIDADRLGGVYVGRSATSRLIYQCSSR